MCSRSPVVGVFLKVPEKGRVKTRLGRDIGMQNAAAFFAVALGWLLGRLRRRGVRHILFYDPVGEEERLREMYGDFEDETLVPQTGSDLGERMRNALIHMGNRFREAPMLIGSDSPDIPLERIQRTASALRRNDLVLGPALDGGYYLIGTRRAARPLFENISWSEPTVLRTTLERARLGGLTTHLLEPWDDVDTLADLRRKM